MIDVMGPKKIDNSALPPKADLVELIDSTFHGLRSTTAPIRSGRHLVFEVQADKDRPSI